MNATDEFIDKARKVHGDKYDYSLAKYLNAKAKMKIICPIHGVFEQDACSHLKGSGCKKCSYKLINKDRKISPSIFVQNGNKVHGDRYDYSLIGDIDNTRDKVKIICPVHGVFEQNYNHHVIKRHGCKYCRESIGERKIRIFFRDKGIYFVQNKEFGDLKDKKNLSYDFYVPDKNLLVEYNGEQHYKFVPALQKEYKRFLSQRHHDWLKRKYARKNDFNLLVIPYWELDNVENILEEYYGSID